MREHKYRAKALTGELVYFELHESQKSGDYEVFYVKGIPCERGTEEDCTGLRDKNGVEIYEGDITCRHWSDGSWQNGQIIYENGSFLWQEINKDRFIHPIGINTLHSVVIGNIYEGLYSGEKCDIIKEWKKNTNEQSQTPSQDTRLAEKPEGKLD